MKAGAQIEASDEPNGDMPTDAFMRHVFAGLAEMNAWKRRSTLRGPCGSTRPTAGGWGGRTAVPSGTA